MAGSALGRGEEVAEPSGETRNMRQFCIHLTTATATIVEKTVARNAVPTMAVGSLDFWAARMAMAKLNCLTISRMTNSCW